MAEVIFKAFYFISFSFFFSFYFFDNAYEDKNETFQGGFRSLICNSHTMICPPVRGDNPLALASGVSPVKAAKTCFNISYHPL